MNILIRMVGFNGGAPRSLLEHAKIYLSQGHNVYAMGADSGKTKLEDLYRNAGVKVIHSKGFTVALQNKNYVTLYFALIELRNVLLSNKIDMLIAVGGTEVFFCSYAAKSVGCSMLSIIPGGNLHTDIMSKLMTKHWCNGHVICFSQENKNSLMKNGISEEKISIIANRVSVDMDLYWKDHYQQERSKVKLFIASRIEPDKLGGIELAIKITQHLRETGIDACLKIAGDGKSVDIVSDYVKEVNRQLNVEAIKMIGYVSDVMTEITEADIVFGKGRSAIEALMKQRITIVVGENKQGRICTFDTFQELYDYNFGGRNITVGDSSESYVKLAENILNNELDLESMQNMFDKAQICYSTLYLEEKLLKVFGMEAEKKCDIHKGSLIKCIVDFIYIKIRAHFDK